MSETRMSTEQIRILYESLRYLTDVPDVWEQEQFATYRNECGTTYCLAGWILAKDGTEFDWALAGSGVPGMEVATDALVGEVREPPDALAAEKIGITLSEADRLFAPNNTLLELWRQASELSGGRIHVPSEVKTHA